jgi:L-aminopeptidase/D-esterase-like protein
VAERPRLRDLGVCIGREQPGPNNAITDVPGVRVGHRSILRGEGRLANAFLCGAVSGYGLMAGHAAGELAAAHATGGALPAAYAADLSPLRYQDDAFTRPGGGRDRLIAGGGGQL